jgi:hypothetical protein
VLRYLSRGVSPYDAEALPARTRAERVVPTAISVTYGGYQTTSDSRSLRPAHFELD